MHPTRRWWTIAGLGLLLGGWAVLVERPAVLLGAAGIGGFLLAAQLHFATAIAGATTTVEQRLARSRVTVDETVPLSVSVESTSSYALTVIPQFPASVDADADAIQLGRNQNRQTVTFDLTFPIAGTIDFDIPAVTATDVLGLYEQRLHVESSASIVVEPRQIDDLHVGAGGDPMAVAFGEHETGRLGTGLEPAEIRQYVPGEAVRQMDWKATARLGEPHVREFEAETDRTVMLVVDVRDRLGQGPEGETMLDHLRQVALGYVDHARRQGDPLGCYTVGNAGLTGAFEASANATHLQSIHRHLLAARPTPQSGSSEPAVFDPATARRRAARLGTDTFGQALRPFLEQPRAYVERLETRPLFAAMRTLTTREHGTHMIVLFTDDADREAVREVVRVARSGGHSVLVFLTPSVLFEPGGVADLQTAYRRYVDFESFRQSLANTDGVAAFEVGPGDRLATVLAGGDVNRRTRGRS